MRKLYHILETSERDSAMFEIVSWIDEKTDPTNTSFVIHDLGRFETEVIPKYFDSSMQSFKRQLNYYGFIKLYDARPAILLKDEKKQKVCLKMVYRHENGWLCKGKEDLLQKISRRSVSSSCSSKKRTHEHSLSSNKRQVHDDPKQQEQFLQCKEKIFSLEKEISDINEKIGEVERKIKIFNAFMEQQLGKRFSMEMKSDRKTLRDIEFSNIMSSARESIIDDSCIQPSSKFSDSNKVGEDNETELNESSRTTNESISDSCDMIILPRAKSGIERLNTNESTSSAQWAMIKEILTDNSKDNSPNLDPHNQNPTCYKGNLSRADSLNTCHG